MKKIILTLLVIVALGLAWWLGSPLFIDRVVEEKMPVAEESAVLLRGEFNDADGFHKGSGQVKIVDGDPRLLRLENFEVTNGPDLFVYLTTNSQPDTAAKVKEGFYDVGRLKGNVGSQNYFIPDDVNLENYRAVVIYCRAFSVLFAFAPLNP